VGVCIVIYSWGTLVNSLILLGLHFCNVFHNACLVREKSTWRLCCPLCTYWK